MIETTVGRLMQVSKELKKLHHLQFLIDWLPSPPSPPCNELTAPPSQIDTFQTTPLPASNPTFMPIWNNLLKSDRVRPRSNFCPQNQVDLILAQLRNLAWIWICGWRQPEPKLKLSLSMTALIFPISMYSRPLPTSLLLLFCCCLVLRFFS